MENPLISIMMPTMNRKNDLREILLRIYEQSYKNIEVIIIDNNSSDGTQKMLVEEFPHVKYICMPRNIGAIAARNVGFANCQGKYILHLDDDSFPGRDCISRMVEEFENDSQLGLIAFKVLDYWEFWHQRGWKNLYDEIALSRNASSLENVNWIGCGGGIRNELRQKVGYYEEWGREAMFERSLAVRILNEGYKIKAFSDIYVYHLWSQSGEPATYRLSEEAIFTGCRSIMLFYLKYFPAKLMLYNAWRLTYSAIFACIEQKTLCYFFALCSALKMFAVVWGERCVIGRAILDRFPISFNFKGK